MNRNTGYTLIESIITLSIVAILASLAIPSFASAMRSIQSQTVIQSVAAAYQLARSSAISSRQPVVFCATTNQQACGTDWTQGAMVFADPDNDRRRDEDEKLLAVLEPTEPGSQLVIRAALNKRYLRFMDNGMLENTAGSFIYCPPGGVARHARNLIFSRNGRLRSGTDQNRDGVLENAEGQPLGCPLQ